MRYAWILFLATFLTTACGQEPAKKKKKKDGAVEGTEECVFGENCDQNNPDATTDGVNDGVTPDPDSSLEDESNSSDEEATDPSEDGEEEDEDVEDEEEDEDQDDNSGDQGGLLGILGILGGGNSGGSPLDFLSGGKDGKDNKNDGLLATIKGLNPDQLKILSDALKNGQGQNPGDLAKLLETIKKD